MKQNNSTQEISRQLLAAGTILIFPHIHIDGDSMGASAALCRGLRSAGKKAAVLIEDEIPEYLQFLDRGYCTRNPDALGEPDVCICVDCGEVSRFPKREDTFFKGKTTICIDHHATSEPFADYNFIDGSIAAASEIVYRLLTEMGCSIDKEMGEAIFAGICTDTGNFQYSNATKESHLIAASLYDAGIDHGKVAVELYQNIRPQRLLITSRIMDNMEIFADGKAAIAYVTKEMLKDAGASMEDTEGAVETLRNIRGVELAAFVKEQKQGVCKASMRAKTTGNVAEIAARFDGGGHIKAAGCTLHTDVEEACSKLKQAMEESLRQ